MTRSPGDACAKRRVANSAAERVQHGTRALSHLADYGGDVLLVLDNIVVRNGSPSPERGIAGSNTQLYARVRLFIDE